MKLNKSTQGKKEANPSTNSSKNFRLVTTTDFYKSAKALIKKYPHIGDDFFALQERLKKDPISGNDPLGQNCYKVRMNVSDKNTGESGGARVIIQVYVTGRTVYVLYVYDKSEFENISDAYLKQLLSAIPK